MIHGVHASADPVETGSLSKGDRSMELSGQQIVAAPRQAVCDALNDPRALYECIPGCEDIEKVSAEETRVRVGGKLGPGRARFTGKSLWSDVTSPDGVT